MDDFFLITSLPPSSECVKLSMLYWSCEAIITIQQVVKTLYRSYYIYQICVYRFLSYFQKIIPKIVKSLTPHKIIDMKKLLCSVRTAGLIHFEWDDSHVCSF